MDEVINMPTIILNKETVLKFLGKRISDKELAEKIPMLGIFLNEISTEEISVEVFPNRPDMLSEEGFARALAGFIGVRTGLEKFSAKPSKFSVEADTKMKSLRPFIGLAVLRGLRFDNNFLKSMMQLQDKLCLTHGRKRKKAGVGVYDLDKLEFPLRYTTISEADRFIPLGETEPMRVKDILEQHARGKEYGEILKGFREFPAYKDSARKILCVLPITQADFTKVTSETKNILIEVTGTNFKNVSQILNILVCNWSERGGAVEQVSVNFPYETPAGKKVSFPLLEPAKMKLNPDYVNKLLGLDLKPAEIIELLRKMRHDGRPAGKAIEVFVAPYRTDILHPIDLVEEVAIAYGYGNFQPEIPNVATIGEETQKTIFSRKLAEICVGLGLQEIQSLHLGNEKILAEKMLLTGKNNFVKVLNSVNADYDTIRNSLIPNLLKVLSENTHYEFPQNLFEIGEVYENANGEPVEKNNLGIVFCHAGAEFNEAKSSVEALFRLLGKTISVEPIEHPSFIESRVGKIICNGKEVGLLGEIHPQALVNFGLELPVVAVEIEVGKMAEVI